MASKSKPKSKRGRPPGGEYAEKSAVMNFRIRPDTKRLLQQAAHMSGRTLSQETEHQIRKPAGCTIHICIVRRGMRSLLR